MKIKIMFVLFSLLFAFMLFKFTVAPASAIVDPSQVSVGSGESLADKLMDTSNTGIMTGDTRFAPTPSKSRKVWANKTGVNFTMPSKLSTGANSAKESRNQAEAVAETQDQTVNNQDTTETAPADTSDQTPTQTSDQTTSSSSTGALAGSWSFELSDNTLKELVLTLFQSEDSVFGTGSMRDGNNTLLVAASGSVDGDKLNLDLTSFGTINLYRLTLTSSGDSASGDYKAFSAGGQSWTGSAKGTKSTA